jgi:hypothetical protein
MDSWGLEYAAIRLSTGFRMGIRRCIAERIESFLTQSQKLSLELAGERSREVQLARANRELQCRAAQLRLPMKSTDGTTGNSKVREAPRSKRASITQRRARFVSREPEQGQYHQLSGGEVCSIVLKERRILLHVGEDSAQISQISISVTSPIMLGKRSRMISRTTRLLTLVMRVRLSQTICENSPKFLGIPRSWGLELPRYRTSPIPF